MGVRHYSPGIILDILYSQKEKRSAAGGNIGVLSSSFVRLIPAVALGAILTSSPGHQKLKILPVTCLFRAPLPKKAQSTPLRRLSHSITSMASMGSVAKTKFK